MRVGFFSKMDSLQINEIEEGVKDGVNVSVYADWRIPWFMMREARIVMKYKLLEMGLVDRYFTKINFVSPRDIMNNWKWFKEQVGDVIKRYFPFRTEKEVKRMKNPVKFVLVELFYDLKIKTDFTPISIKDSGVQINFFLQRNFFLNVLFMIEKIKRLSVEDEKVAEFFYKKEQWRDIVNEIRNITEKRLDTINRLYIKAEKEYMEYLNELEDFCSNKLPFLSQREGKIALSEIRDKLTKSKKKKALAL